MNTMRILLVDGAEREPWYAPLRRLVHARWIIGAAPRWIANARAEIDLAMVSDERALPHTMDAVSRLARQDIPVLHLIDGILEWRNTWENPTFALGNEPAAPFLQPSLCHKIACLGRSQARVLESWGNLSKCEVVGLPRLDDFLWQGGIPRVSNPPASTRGEFRLLVTTARTAGFTPDQIAAVERSLADLKAWLECHAKLGGRSVQVVWRLTGDLAARIGVDNCLGDVFGSELLDMIGDFDAMVSTPSTAQLEGMAAGIPVALLDYNNRPHYVGAAWNITASSHLESVLAELADPPADKMLYQDTVLHDALECRTPAGPRLQRLINEMARLGRESRSSGRALILPRRILADPQDDHHLPESRFDYSQLYPGHPVFGQMDRTELQMQIAQLRREIARQGVLETHPVFGPALRLRRRLRRLLARMRDRLKA